MEQSQPADYDFVVTDIAYVIDRPANPQWRIESFTNRWSHILVYAISGRAEYEIAGSAYSIRSGDVIFMPKGIEHSAASTRDDPWHFVSVAFDTSNKLGNDLDQLMSLPSLYRDASTHHMSAIFTELFVSWTDKGPGYLIRLRGLVTDIMYALIRLHVSQRIDNPHSQHIARIVEMMTTNYRKTYSVSALATMAGISPSYFRLLFKKVTGQTLTQYQHQIKITKAKEFLLSGECNVTQAAHRAGFRDVYYFSRLFKQVTGTNPSDFTRA